MALKSNNTALAVAIQSVTDVFTTPTQPTDLMPCSNLRLDIAGVSIANDEYTGSPFRNGDVIAGKKATLSFNVKLRPPGGVSIPAANAFLVGRLLQAAKFAEVRTAAAIPAAPEALGTGSTARAAKLGATAVGTVDLYKGQAILLGSGTYKQNLSAIRGNDAAKLATLVEDLGSAPTGNYQIPQQIGYMRSISSTDPILLSLNVWISGHRFDMINARVAVLQIVVPTSTKDQAAYPEIQITMDVQINTNVADPTPAITPLGAIPLYKDGDGELAYTRVGLSTFTVDLGLQTENPPNPNKVDGVDASELVSGAAKVSMTRQKYLPAVLDTLALADNQAQWPFFAQWGTGVAGGMVQVVVPDGRFDYQNIDLGQTMVMENGDLVIDAYDRSVVINFPF